MRQVFAALFMLTKMVLMGQDPCAVVYPSANPTPACDLMTAPTYAVPVYRVQVALITSYKVTETQKPLTTFEAGFLAVPYGGYTAIVSERAYTYEEATALKNEYLEDGYCATVKFVGYRFEKPLN
jgi:hypothetical protein